MQRYWTGDGAWLAIDGQGHVAVFTTGGVAPIPVVVLERYSRSAEEAVNNQPILGGYECRPYPGKMSSFTGFATRGFFAYDWCDIHRTAGFTRSYELIATPIVPLVLARLESELLQMAKLVTLPTVTFKKTFTLQIESLCSCESP